jgi:predicted DNA-binding protein (MmcQ/YjbR family)
VGRAKDAESSLIAFAASLPGAWEDHPRPEGRHRHRRWVWDHRVMKVGRKVFAFFGSAATSPDTLSLSTKLPISAEMALTLPYTQLAGHGLGKAGWIQSRLTDGDEIDEETFRAWIVQSYKAVATKKLIKELEAAA